MSKTSLLDTKWWPFENFQVKIMITTRYNQNVKYLNNSLLSDKKLDTNWLGSVPKFIGLRIAAK